MILAGGGNAMAENLATVAQLQTLPEAVAARQFLMDEGISAFLN